MARSVDGIVPSSCPVSPLWISEASVHDDPCGASLQVRPASLVRSVPPEDPPSPRLYCAALDRKATSVASKRLNRLSITPICVRRARKSQSVLAYGTRPHSPRPRKRIKDRRSLIRYFVRRRGCSASGSPGFCTSEPHHKTDGPPLLPSE